MSGTKSFVLFEFGPCCTASEDSSENCIAMDRSAFLPNSSLDNSPTLISLFSAYLDSFIVNRDSLRLIVSTTEEIQSIACVNCSLLF